MKRPRLLRAVTLSVWMWTFLAIWAGPAHADNCDLRINPEDCQNTAWTIGTIAATAAAVTAATVAIAGARGAGGAEGAGPPAVPGRTVGQIASGGPPRNAPEGHPTIHQQQAGDSCAVVSIQMIHERATGETIPQNALRAQSHQLPGGYRKNAGNWGTSTDGVVTQLRGLGHDAKRQNQSPQQMQQTLQGGGHVTVSIKVPGGGNHRVVVSGVEQRGPRTLMTFDDPWTGQQFQRTDLWWNSNGNPGRTIVVQPPEQPPD